jgi:hypothetical protein
MSETLSETTNRWLFDNGYNPKDLDGRGKNGDTAIMRAIREGAGAIAKDLIDAGANINLRNNDGNNALWFACYGDRYNLIDLLADSGIDLDNQNDNGATALM